MKKYIIFSFFISLLFLGSCSIDFKDEKDNKISELEKQIMDLKNTNSNLLGKEIKILKPTTSTINKSLKYSLDCKTKYFTNTIIEGDIINNSFIKTSEGHEKEILYIENESAKFFGADFSVIQDDEQFLIISRVYEFSGLIETVTINKNLGIGFDVKTMGLGISGAPVSDTYLLSCSEI